MFKTVYRYSLYVILNGFVLSVFAAPKFTLDTGEKLVDPTQPDSWSAPQTVQKGIKEPAFELNYIVVSAGQRRAMINGEKVIEGDYVSGARVTRITQNSVHLSYQGQDKELRINKIKGIQRN